MVNYYYETEPTLERPSLWDIVKAFFLVTIIEAVAAIPLLVAYGEAALNEPQTLPSHVLIAYFVVTSFALGWVAWHFRCRKYGYSFADGLALTRPTNLALIVAVILPIVELAASLGISILLATNDPTLPDESPLARLTSTQQGILAFAVAAIIGAPIEELFFRGFMFPHINARLGPFIAVVITGIVFALLHAQQLAGDMPAITHILVGGIMLTLQRYYTNSVVPGIISHTLFNGILCCVGLYESFAAK